MDEETRKFWLLAKRGNAEAQIRQLLSRAQQHGLATRSVWRLSPQTESAPCGEKSAIGEATFEDESGEAAKTLVRVLVHTPDWHLLGHVRLGSDVCVHTVGTGLALAQPQRKH